MVDTRAVDEPVGERPRCLLASTLPAVLMKDCDEDDTPSVVQQQLFVLLCRWGLSGMYV